MEEKAYGKKSLWQWILIYAVIGVLVYGLIYYFVLAGKGGLPSYTSQPTSAPITTQATPSSKPLKMTVKLNEENNSGESGEAILEEENGKTTVTVSLTGFTQGIPQPAHIHAGVCPGVGTVKYPLSNIIDGSSVTVLDATLADIKQNLPLAINVHKSAQDITNYTACGGLGN